MKRKLVLGLVVAIFLFSIIAIQPVVEDEEILPCFEVSYFQFNSLGNATPDSMFNIFKEDPVEGVEDHRSDCSNQTEIDTPLLECSFYSNIVLNRTSSNRRE